MASLIAGLSRPQKLAAIAALLSVVLPLAVWIDRLYERIDEQNRIIRHLEDEIVSLHHALTEADTYTDYYETDIIDPTRVSSIEAAQDQLRSELYRLATTTRTLDPDIFTRQIVDIYKLTTVYRIDEDNGSVTLTTRVLLEPAPIEAALRYVHRVEQSILALRIDDLRIEREPLQDDVLVELQVVRTIVSPAITYEP